MQTALDLPEDRLNDYERRMVAAIREHGWWGTSVVPKQGSDSLSFSYTTGLWRTLGHPELIVFSLGSDAANHIFRHICEEAKQGRRFGVHEPFDGLFDTFPAVLLPADSARASQFALSANWFYGEDYESLQLVWPDEDSRFPWEAGVNPDVARSQLDLTSGNWAGLARGKG